MEIEMETLIAFLDIETDKNINKTMKEYKNMNEVNKITISEAQEILLKDSESLKDLNKEEKKVNGPTTYEKVLEQYLSGIQNKTQNNYHIEYSKCNCGSIDKCPECLACVGSKNKNKPWGHFETCSLLDKNMIMSYNAMSEGHKEAQNGINEIKKAKSNYGEEFLGTKCICGQSNCMGFCLSCNACSLVGHFKSCVFYKKKEEKIEKTEKEKDKIIMMTADEYTENKKKKEFSKPGCACNNPKCIGYCNNCAKCSLEGHIEKCKYSSEDKTTIKSTTTGTFGEQLPTAKFYKLKNGTWAITTAEKYKIGTAIPVTKKDGSVTIETISSYYGINYNLSDHTYVYLIEKKYKKGNHTPLDKDSNNNSSVKVVNQKKQSKYSHYKYDVTIWEYQDVFNIGLNINIDKFKEKTVLKNFPHEAVVELIKSHEKLNEKEGFLRFIIYAKRFDNYHDSYPDVFNGYYDKGLGSTDIINKLLEQKIAKEEAVLNKDRTWIACGMTCNSFPARSQKIKGVRDISSIIKYLVDESCIQHAYVVSENLDIDKVIHKHNYIGYGNFKYDRVGRKALNEIEDEIIGKFMRPCPENPEHGFVDSRLVKNREEIDLVIEEIRKTGEIPEFIVMDKVECEYSGVITPDRIVLGKLNDGATSGKDAFEIPLELGNENQEKMAEYFWNKKEKYCSKCKGSYNIEAYKILISKNPQDYTDINTCINCKVELENKWPFIEILYENKVEKPKIVQLRAGPQLKIENEKILVKKVVEINSEMDLIEWGKLSKKLKEEIINVKENDSGYNSGNKVANETESPSKICSNNESSNSSNSNIVNNTTYSRICPVVWHPGGALSSHFGVHCKETKLPYITSIEKPIENSIIEIGLKSPTNLEAIREGLVIGFDTPIEREYDPHRIGVKKDLKNFLGSLHLYALADLGNYEVSRFLGYSWAVGIRIISGLPLGEARHNDQLRKNLDDMVGKLKFKKDGYETSFSFNTGKRDIIYNLAWRLDLEKLLSCLIEAHRGFKELKWSSGYGGKAWASCTISLLRVLIAVKEFLNEQNSEKLQDVIDHINIMVNEAHNNGWWLNKLLMKTDFDNASILPHFYISPELAFRVKTQNESLSLSKFAMKLKGYNIAKKLGLIEILPQEMVDGGDETVKEVKIENSKDVNIAKPNLTKEEIIENINYKAKYIKAQYTATLSNIHIQIRSFNINREYGYSGSYQYGLGNKSQYQSVINNIALNHQYYHNFKSLTGSSNNYSYCDILKGKQEGEVIIRIAHNGNVEYIQLTDIEVWNNFDKIVKWQETRGKDLITKPLEDKGEVNEIEEYSPYDDDNYYYDSTKENLK